MVRVEFPELSTSEGWVTPAESGRSINLFGHAGVLLFYSTVLSYLLFRWKGYYRPGAVERIARKTVRRAVRSSVGIATMVGMAVAMQHAGMTRALAEGVADAVGEAFPLASPFIGALGAFMTGSNTNSNVVFGSFQQDAATLLGLNVLIILASQTAGAAIGSAFAPAKVIVGAISPDNFPVPPGLFIKSSSRKTEAETRVFCAKGAGTLLATLDDLLSSIQLAEKTIRTLEDLS